MCGAFLLLNLLAADTGAVPVATGPDPREAKAREACLAGNPQAGVALLASLYVETRNATYVYNQARCYQQNGHNEQAASHFREYLRLDTSVSAEERAKVEGYIRELEVTHARPAAVPAPSLPQLLVAAPAEVAPAPASRSIFTRWWFWGVVGAVAAGTTAAFLATRGGSAGWPACPTDGICPR